MDNDRPKARAARMRAALRPRYHGVTFSVTSCNRGSDYGNLTVTWTDGPTEEEVRRFAAPYGTRTLRYGGIQTSRSFSPEVQDAAEAIWTTAAASTPEKKIYPSNEAHGWYEAWDHEGVTVPKGTDWGQKKWLIDNVILPTLGQGAAMTAPEEPVPGEPEQAGDIDPAREKPRLHAVPERPPVAGEGAGRKETVLGFLNTLAGDIRSTPDDLWELPEQDQDVLRIISRTGTLVTGALLAELTVLMNAVAHTHADPSTAGASSKLTLQMIGRLARAETPVLRAALGKEPK
ncbi:LPD29 domain-containing protein [Streptomyces yaizuensis]|uniref:LPD29 domain-containing protein n=1 Tax=Streptomyces yaizuensis TaxID=2989713 RepID=UPI002B1FEE17|nr:LPD29 domain-containing protein [Streptomyces sp. YSPA8]